MTDNWDSYFCTVEGRPASMLVNLGLADAAPLAGYPVSAYVGVILKAPDQHGFPAEDEYDALSRIEDAFMAAASRPGFRLPPAEQPAPEDACGDELPAGGVYAGRCATNGRFILFFYLPAAFGGASLEAWREQGAASGGESWGARAEAVMAAFPDYAWEAGAEEDPEWKGYSEFLFPDGFALLGIQNARLLRNLEEAGDDTALSRRIDHFAVFPGPEQAEAFLETIEGLGFAVTGLDRIVPEREDGNGAEDSPPAPSETPPDAAVRVRFSRSDPPQAMDEVTCILWDAAAGQGGAYEGWGASVTGSGEGSPEDYA